MVESGTRNFGLCKYEKDKGRGGNSTELHLYMYCTGVHEKVKGRVYLA